MSMVAGSKASSSAAFLLEKKKNKKLPKILSTWWRSWVVTVIYFVVGIAVVLYFKKKSEKPYSIPDSLPWRISVVEDNTPAEEDSKLAEPFNFNVTSVERQQTNENDGYFLQQTKFRGNEAVERVKAHLACFSDMGQWEYDPTPRKLPWLISMVFHNEGYGICDATYSNRSGGIFGQEADAIALSEGSDGFGNWSVREELKWVWRTHDESCPWRSMNRDDFCRRIGSNRNVLLAGDSISELTYFSMLSALAMNLSSVVNQDINTDGEELCSDILGGVGKGFTVKLGRNDLLSLITKERKTPTTLERPWMHLLGDCKILVLNRGQHYEEDSEFIKGLRTTFSFLRDNHPDLLVFYRNTIPGHVNCYDYREPLKMQPRGGKDEWQWEDHHRQNMISKLIVEEFHYIYLDAARPVGMRPEGHLFVDDCLHYCLPGPLDFNVEMLYNALIVLESDP